MKGTPSQDVYGYVPPKGGRDFETPYVERGIHIRAFQFVEHG